MVIRPAVVEIVSQCAFAALASCRVPEDVTAREEAEGLIAYAMRLLNKASDAEEAFETALDIVIRYKPAPPKAVLCTQP